MRDEVPDRDCLSIDLIPIASEAGHDAQHVARVGKAGWKNWNVVRTAADGGFVLVTNNASDFRKLYATTPLHAGLIIIVPNVDWTLQKVLFRAALEAVFMPNDLVQSRARGRHRRRGCDARSL
jgi:predicted nuclease of predicted toxin-antitoxin system